MATMLEILQISLFILGYCAYIDVWELTIAEVLLAKPVPSNVRVTDKSAIAVREKVNKVAAINWK